MKTILFTGLIVLLAIATVSCSDNDSDTTPPVIDLISPAEGAALLIGSDIHFSMELSDNEMLASYKVEIHSNFDGHQHTRVDGETTPFDYRNTWSVAGQKNASVHHHEIVIPDNATPGDYHLLVYCADAAGNEANVARNIVLKEDGEAGEEHGH